MPLQDKLRPSLQKKLLALDGGGIRGLVSIEVLAQLERMLRSELGRGDEFRLSDYFDYVAGTSTGAIIATCVSLGMSVDEIREFYERNGRAMFSKASFLHRFRYRFDDQLLATRLREAFNSYAARDGSVSGELTLGSPALQTLLMLVMRNATTDSPWPISNNPAAPFNDRSLPDCNLHIPLWQLVRASSAAPTYFPPEEIRLGERSFLFVDGGVTPYNNPAFLLFLMATVPAYRLSWPTGVERMLVVSVGTGAHANANAELAPDQMNLLFNAMSIPSALMYASMNQQDMLCRVFSRCRVGDALDAEVESLMSPEDAESGSALPKLFTYMRYNAELDSGWLAQRGLAHIDASHVRQMDSVEHTDELQDVGRALAKQVRAEHFRPFLAPESA
ncbi:MAG: patatin-like phospholipase family protein [Gemmatimonas sp.]